MKAVTYARVSGDDRGRNNLESQIADCREYCAKKGYQIIEELKEDERGVSGAIRLPPQIERALDLAEDGLFDVLVIREMDRLARGIAKQMNLDEMFPERGVRIEYILDTFDDSPEGQLLKTVKGGINEYEKTKIAIRMRRGRRWRVKQGRIMLHGNAAPYGYRAEERRDNFGNITAKWLVIHEPEAQIVRKIFRWYVYGDEHGKRLSICAIADRLTGMQVPTWSDTHGSHFPRKGGYGEWSESGVGKLLQNETYAGTWHYGKRGTSTTNDRENWLAVEDPSIIIVDPETFRKAQERREWNQRFYSKKTSAEYLLRGRVICGHCRSEMIARAEKKGRYTYYVCPRGQGRHIGQTCPNNTYWKAEDVDVQAWYELQAELYDPETLRQNLRNRKEYLAKVNGPILEQLEITDRLIEKHQKRLERALSHYLDESWDREMVEAERVRVQGVIDSLEKQKRELQEELDKSGLLDLDDHAIDWLCKVAETLCRNQYRAYDDVPLEEKQKFIDSLDCKATLSLKDGEKQTSFRFHLSTSVNPDIRTGGGWQN